MDAKTHISYVILIVVTLRRIFFNVYAQLMSFFQKTYIQKKCYISFPINAILTGTF